MVAADDKDLDALFRQAGNKAIKQCHRLCLGRRPLIHVPRNQHRLRPLAFSDGNDLLQNDLLILQQRQIVHLLAQMQISYMEKSHPYLPPVII